MLRRIRCKDDDDAKTAATFNLDLPDNVIEKILSFLPVKDAVQATAVSKQWKALWPSFPVIDLDEKRFTEPRHFISFLRYSLRQCRDQKQLDKLRIRANLLHGYGLVSQWVDFATEMCFKELDVRNLGENSWYLIAHEVLTVKSLTTLKLENVRLYASTEVSGPVCLPLLKTMSLTKVTFIDDKEERATWAVPSLISGCPRLQQLSIKKCLFGKSTSDVEITSDSLISLEIMDCHSTEVVVNAKNLESFRFHSDCHCPYHKNMCLWQCDNLKHVDISCVGLKNLLLQSCFKTMENSFYTPKLMTFVFNGYMKTKVHFVEAPSNLRRVTISIWGASWPFEYFAGMRDFFESFDCSKKVRLRIHNDECLKIPEQCRMEWSSPLPSIKQLQLYFYGPVEDREYYLRPSLNWLAPSAEIILLDEDEVEDEDEDEDEDEYDDDDGDGDDNEDDDDNNDSEEDDDDEDDDDDDDDDEEYD